MLGMRELVTRKLIVNGVKEGSRLFFIALPRHEDKALCDATRRMTTRDGGSVIAHEVPDRS